jgi:hypothetical protein
MFLKNMPKKKGDKGGNPNPVRPPEVEAKVFSRKQDDPYPDVPLTKKLQIWMYEPVVKELEKMSPSDRTLWLRKVITEAAIKELGVVINV